MTENRKILFSKVCKAMVSDYKPTYRREEQQIQWKRDSTLRPARPEYFRTKRVYKLNFSPWYEITKCYESEPSNVANIWARSYFSIVKEANFDFRLAVCGVAYIEDNEMDIDITFSKTFKELGFSIRLGKMAEKFTGTLQLGYSIRRFVQFKSNKVHQRCEGFDPTKLKSDYWNLMQNS